MGLNVIGAGFGRNGTESLKRALEMLGFGPCYHMHEVLGHPDRIATWRGAAQGDLPDWEAVFAEYKATVDWPAAFFWRELSAQYPDAKVILSVRDPESWYASMDKTILKVLRESTNTESVGVSLVANRVFGGQLDSKDHILAAYAQNTREVQAAFGPDRLLTYELGSGWAPLCEFLGVGIPDEPYPRGNAESAFHSKLEELSAERANREAS